MKKVLVLASLGALTLTSAAAQADHNWRKRKLVQREGIVYLYEEDDEGFVSYDDEDDDVIYLNRRQRQMREAEREVDAELWWLEERAQQKLERRAKSRSNIVKKADAKAAVKKPVAKPKAVVAAKKAKSPVAELQTASLSKPAPAAKPKPVLALTKPKSSLPAPKTVATKTIGCTAGAAVVTGYGFAEVKPKACTGTTYAYTAARSGKSYEIKMTAASGEIVDVKKLN